MRLTELWAVPLSQGSTKSKARKQSCPPHSSSDTGTALGTALLQELTACIFRMFLFRKHASLAQMKQMAFLFHHGHKNII